jgi:hypothetical protein
MAMPLKDTKKLLKIGYKSYKAIIIVHSRIDAYNPIKATKAEKVGHAIEILMAILTFDIGYFMGVSPNLFHYFNY